MTFEQTNTMYTFQVRTDGCVHYFSRWDTKWNTVLLQTRIRSHLKVYFIFQ